MRLEEGGAYSFHWILESVFTSCCHLPLYIDGSSGSGNILWTQQLATVDTFCLLFASQPPGSSSETSITNDQCPLLRGPMFFPRSEITEIDKQCPSLENQSCTSQGLHLSLSKTLGSGIFSPSSHKLQLLSQGHPVWLCSDHLFLFNSANKSCLKNGYAFCLKIGVQQICIIYYMNYVVNKTEYSKALRHKNAEVRKAHI